MKKWVFSVALLSLAYGYAQDNTNPQAEPTPMTMPAEVLQQIAAPKTEDKIEIKLSRPKKGLQLFCQFD